jgi:hypothetical protein
MKYLSSAVKLILVSGLALLASASPTNAAPVKVELVRTVNGWQLKRDGQPFFVKGAGGTERLDLLAAAGANSVRTWGADNLERLLDEAQKNGLTVTVGIWLRHEGAGDRFSYEDPEQCQQQLETVRKAALRYKDHPAVLMWGIGNEMEGEAGDKPAIWQAVEAAAKLTKQIDPNHPTMTVIAEIGGQKIPSLEKFCPDIDLVGINSYGGGPSLGERYAKSGGTKPYIVTEFGPVGSWETEKTSWGAAYEQTSTEKADWYRRIYKNSIAGKPLCLGAYAFLWGQKQETTATWFGMFLTDGTKVQAVDTMTELWSGQPPATRCPVIRHIALRGRNEFASGTNFTADLEAADPGGLPLQVRWVVQPEQANQLTGGAEEGKLPELASLILQGDARHAEVRAPAQPGGYRLFAYVRNGAGAAVANLPFYVVTNGKKDGPAPVARLPFVIYSEQGSPNNHYVPSGWMGNTKAIKMDEGCRIHPHSGETCLRFEYQDASGWGGVVWQDPAEDWGDKVGGWNLSGAKQLTFWARGEKGGEEVNFEFGLLGRDKPHRDSSSGSLSGIKLTTDWKQYRLDLTGKDLSCIKTGFCWTVKAQNNPAMFYLDDIQFE